MKLDEVKKLQQKKYRQQFGHFLVEGEHLVLELQRAVAQHPALAASTLYVTEKYQHWASPFVTQVVSERQMAQLSDTRSPQGILAVVPTTFQPDAEAAQETAIYLSEVQDPGNLGTIMRTLAWFGGFRLLLSPGSVDPFNAKVVRASMGAIFHLPIELDITPAVLTQRYQHFGCLDMQGDPLPSAQLRHAQCILFGNEARGVDAALADALGARRFTIAGAGAVESLNLASAVNICAWELCR